MRNLLLAAVFAALLPAIAFAQMGGMGMGGTGPMKGMSMGRHHMNFVQDLNLSKDQINKVRDIRMDSRKKNIEISNSMQLKQLDFDRELQKEKPDKATLDKLISELGDLAGQRHKLHLESKVKMMDNLTAEQKEKLASKMGAAMMFGGPGGGGDMGGGPKDGGPAGPGGPGAPGEPGEMDR